MNHNDLFQFLTPETLALIFKDVAQVIKEQGGDASNYAARDAVFNYVSQSGFLTEDEKVRWAKALGR